MTRFKIKSEIERMAYFHLKLNNYLYNQSLQTVTADTTSPKFVYTHLEMPHYPYYFDSEGKPNSFDKITEENYYNQDYYIEYLQYCNKQYLQLIDHIQQNSKTPPVIIFMSDHSFRDFERDSVNRKYHFMNMNMVNLPSGNYSGFYKGISSVNQFRVIMNSEFGQKLPLIKDSTSFLSE